MKATQREAERAKASMSGTCYYCGPTDRELRPYGPGAATVCFACATATPEREQAAHAAFDAQLDMTASVGLSAIGTESGPINVDVEDLGSMS